MTIAWVGLGANRGAPATTIRKALEDLNDGPDTRVLARSRLYRTRPWGPVEQPDFINAVAKLETTLSAEALLDGLLAIEARHGRERGEHIERWGPRTLDLDLLLYGDETIVTDKLQVPHPRMAERAFVLVPLAELAPALEVPGRGRVEALLARTGAEGVVELAA
jgi:2-amino-4-hydroxy-6-hydroxymethyldihydropteridine diphosphokinase